MQKLNFKNLIKENFYQIFRFRLDKFSNFETPSPNYAAPTSPILFPLINFNFQYGFSFFIPIINNLI
jgi:hypothetical protein